MNPSFSPSSSPNLFCSDKTSKQKVCNTDKLCINGISIVGATFSNNVWKCPDGYRMILPTELNSPEKRCDIAAKINEPAKCPDGQCIDRGVEESSRDDNGNCCVVKETRDCEVNMN